MAHFAVTLVHGPNWDPARPIREQDRWDEHAAFMDGLVDTGFIIIGGPVGDGQQTLHVVQAADEAAVIARFAGDPWALAGLLEIGSIRPWSLWLDGRAKGSMGVRSQPTALGPGSADGAQHRAERLRLYGATSESASLDWDWVDGQLTAAGLYWVVASPSDRPHPRPVWGIWHDHELFLSVGSPALLRVTGAPCPVTVHLDSGVDVVIVEGTGARCDPTPPELVDAYNRKYDWNYQVVKYGELTRVTPMKVLAWRSAGPAGRDGFSATGRWVFD